MKNTDASTVPTLYHLFANKTSALSLLADSIAPSAGTTTRTTRR